MQTSVVPTDFDRLISGYRLIQGYRTIGGPLLYPAHLVPGIPYPLSFMLLAVMCLGHNEVVHRVSPSSFIFCLFCASATLLLTGLRVRFFFSKSVFVFSWHDACMHDDDDDDDDDEANLSSSEELQKSGEVHICVASVE